MEGSAAIEDLTAPESWEVADVDESMRRLMLKDSEKDPKSVVKPPLRQLSSPCELDASMSSGGRCSVGEKNALEDAVNGVDQFLREALQNPRERLSVLRLDQDVEKFIRDPLRQQMEFQQLPTSYLRLAAHRVAQHYSLQSMVLLDNSLPDGSGSRIIIRKTSESRLPYIRLADIPLNLPSDDSGPMKVAIKQRPGKQSHSANNLSDGTSKVNSLKTVEERKEEYNKARARIFNSSGGTSSGKPDVEPKPQIASQFVASCMPKNEERDMDGNSGRGIAEASTSNNKSARSKSEKEPIGRNKGSSRVAIFRDREVEKKDPDYDRSYDRYMQRFDPGFGFSGGSYSVKPLYAPAINYNTEFPQLSSNRRPQVPTEQPPLPPPQHLPAPWSTFSNPAGGGYSHPDAVIPPFNPSHAAQRPASTMYVHSHYPGQHLGMSYMHPQDHVQPFAQSHQQPADTAFGIARPR